jgi:hypothetical protein
MFVEFILGKINMKGFIVISIENDSSGVGSDGIFSSPSLEDRFVPDSSLQNFQKKKCKEMRIAYSLFLAAKVFNL